MKAVLESPSKWYKDLKKEKGNFTITLLLEKITSSKLIVSVGCIVAVTSPELNQLYMTILPLGDHCMRRGKETKHLKG